MTLYKIVVRDGGELVATLLTLGNVYAPTTGALQEDVHLALHCSTQLYFVQIDEEGEAAVVKHVSRAAVDDRALTQNTSYDVGNDMFPYRVQAANDQQITMQAGDPDMWTAALQAGPTAQTLQVDVSDIDTMFPSCDKSQAQIMLGDVAYKRMFTDQPTTGAPIAQRYLDAARQGSTQAALDRPMSRATQSVPHGMHDTADGLDDDDMSQHHVPVDRARKDERIATQQHLKIHSLSGNSSASPSRKRKDPVSHISDTDEQKAAAHAQKLLQRETNVLKNEARKLAEQLDVAKRQAAVDATQRAELQRLIKEADDAKLAAQAEAAAKSAALAESDAQLEQLTSEVDEHQRVMTQSDTTHEEDMQDANEQYQNLLERFKLAEAKRHKSSQAARKMARANTQMRKVYAADRERQALVAQAQKEEADAVVSQLRKELADAKDAESMARARLEKAQADEMVLAVERSERDREMHTAHADAITRAKDDMRTLYIAAQEAQAKQYEAELAKQAQSAAEEKRVIETQIAELQKKRADDQTAKTAAKDEIARLIDRLRMLQMRGDGDQQRLTPRKRLKPGTSTVPLPFESRATTESDSLDPLGGEAVQAVGIESSGEEDELSSSDD